MPFGVPMLWREPRIHHEDCYFCVTNVVGLNRQKQNSWKYPSLETAVRPQPHSASVPIPVYRGGGPEFEEDAGLAQGGEVTPDSDDWYEPEEAAEKFNQGELDDLIRVLRLPKESAEVLASRLKEKHLLLPGTT